MTHDESGTSRRQFVKAVGASGAAAGFTGHLDAGVGAVEQDGGTTTIQWAADSNVKEIESELQQAMYEAGLSKDIEVNVLAGANVTGRRRSQYQQWLSAGRSKPDLLMMDSGWTIPFIVRDQLWNLSENLPEQKLTQVNRNYLDPLTSTARGPDGDLWGVPFFPDIATIQYRKDLFRKAGHPPQDSWATESMKWKQFSNIVKDVLNQTDTQYGFAFQAKSYEGLSCCDFNEFISSWGGAYFGNPEKYLFGPVGERPITVDEKQVVNSIRMIRTFIHGTDAPNTLDGYAGNISPPAVLQWSEEPSRKPFTAGDAVALRNWSYSIRINASKNNFGNDLGVMPIPYAKTEEESQYPMTGGPVSALGGWHNSINPNSNKKEATVEVLKSMMTNHFMARLWELNGWMPPETDLLKKQRFKEVPVMGRYVDSLRVAAENAISRPVTVVWPTESSQISQAVNSAYSEGGQPKQAMTQLARKLKAIENQA